MLLNELIGKNVRMFLKSGISFSGRLIEIDGDFLKFDDRYNGMKIIAIDTIENLQEWKRK